MKMGTLTTPTGLRHSTGSYGFVVLSDKYESGLTMQRPRFGFYHLVSFIKNLQLFEKIESNAENILRMGNMNTGRYSNQEKDKINCGNCVNLQRRKKGFEF